MSRTTFNGRAKLNSLNPSIPNCGSQLRSRCIASFPIPRATSPSNHSQPLSLYHTTYPSKKPKNPSTQKSVSIYIFIQSQAQHQTTYYSTVVTSITTLSHFGSLRYQSISLSLAFRSSYVSSRTINKSEDPKEMDRADAIDSTMASLIR